MFRITLLKVLLISIFVIFSLVDILFVKKYYTEIRKTQFREMTEYVVKENTNSYPIINQVTAWQQQYYFKKFKSTARVISGPKDKIVDSIINKTESQWNLEGFWIVGAHGDRKLDEARLKGLSNRYVLMKEKTFQDAWAQLFVSKETQTDRYRVIGYNDFAPNEGTIFPEDERIALWGGILNTKPVSLLQGSYNLTIAATGTPVRDEAPHINIYCNDVKIASYYTPAELKDTTFIFENRQAGKVVLKIELDNDLTIEGEGDRNVFLKYIVLKKN